MANSKPKKSNNSNKAPSLYAWSVSGEGEKAFWQKIGACWSHKDGKGLSLQLEALPVNGRIVLRQPVELK